MPRKDKNKPTSGRGPTATKAGRKKNEPLKSNVSVVGVGASAGGLEAFTQFLSHLDVTTGMAFVLVQHLDPTHESLLSEILGRATTMPVSQVTDGTVIKPNHIYVMPPNVLMSINADTLNLKPRGITTGVAHCPVDDFFRSLAHDRKENAIGIVLSGTGSDGSNGISAIASEGGTTFAQEAKSAKFDGMPAAAISEGVDFIMTPASIAAEIGKIALNSRSHPRADEPDGSKPKGEPIDIQGILSFLTAAKGMNFLHYKSPTVQRRIHRRMTLNKTANPDEYLAFLKANPAEIDSLYEDILIKVTSFFRNPESFAALTQHVFPKVIAQSPRPPSIRIWVPGCATGEEAYSIAICLLEFLENNDRSAKIEIFATDISDIALTKARIGYYDESIEEQVSPNRLRRFFMKEGHGYRVAPRLRECCVFAKQDVTRDPPFSRLDLISCRNLMIYLTPPIQKRILAAFHFGLNPNGFLVLGNAETIGAATDLFNVTDKSNKIFSKNAEVRGTLTPDFAMAALAKNTENTQSFAGLQNKPAEKVSLKSQADRAILSKFTPPGVIVNENMEILEVRGDTTPYLKLPPGALTANLAKMCRPGLLVELRQSIYEAGINGEAVKKDGWIKVPGQKSIPIVIDVIPFTDSHSSQQFFAVLFGEKLQGTALAEVPADDSHETRRLERELAETKEYLNAIIEKEQATNEELKSASEEILSANEELQSTNEEMATAKEETQATNEELTTVNEELQNSNQELGRVNNDLANLFSSVQIPLVMLTEDLIIRRFSDSSRKALNLSEADIGSSLANVTSNFQLDQLPKLVEEVLESLHAKDLEIQDQSGRWYSLRIRPYRTLDNRIDGVVMALVDIDSLKSTFARLKEAHDFADAIVQTAPVPLLVLDADLRITTANQAFCRHFRTDEIETQNLRIYDLANGQWNVPKLRELLEKILPKNQIMENFIVDHKFVGLGRRTMRLSARRLVLKTEADAKILLAIQDITAEKRAEETTIFAKESAEAANQAKSDFLANMSHEIRTPLGIILGYAEMLANTEQKKIDTVQSAAKIRKSVEQLTELIDEVLDIAKVESGKLDIERVRFALLPELSETFALLNGRAESKGLTLDISFETEIPKYIKACPKRLRQILFNIVGNALKFTEEGGVQISVSLQPTTSGKDRPSLCFVIQDSGCGLTKEQQSRLFQPFSQADTSVTRRFGGTGLGLMLARRLAEALGGTVELTKSTIGKGSTFTITLDPGDLEDVLMLQEVTKESLERTEAKTPDWFTDSQRLAGMKILLVEDSPDIQVLMEHFLTKSGASVEIAKNGVEALECTKDSSHDLVLMDIQMPILGGYEATKKLREEGYKTPIIALTAHAMRGEREKCIAAGFDDYISKPVKPNALIDIAANVIKKKVLTTHEPADRSLMADDPCIGPLVSGFVKNLPKRMATLHEAQQRSDWREVASQAHQMLGSAASYGFPELGQVAAKMETQAKEDPNPKALADTIIAFDSLCKRAIRGLSHHH